MRSTQSNTLKLAFVSAVAFFGVHTNAFAGCTQTAPGAKTVAVVDGTAACVNAGQAGCSISNGTGSCQAFDGNGNPVFTATSSLDTQGRVSWSVTGPYKADTVLVAGANSGNTCGYFYDKDTASGTGLGFLKTNGTYQGVQGVAVCSDLKADAPQAVLNVVPACPADIQAALDDGTIEGDFAIVGKVTDGDSVTLCTRKNAGLTETLCINQEGKTLPPTLAGTPRCSEGPDLNGDGIPDGPLPLKRNISFPASKVGDGSCLYICSPPNTALEGTSSCKYVCK